MMLMFLEALYQTMAEEELLEPPGPEAAGEAEARENERRADEAALTMLKSQPSPSDRPRVSLARAPR